MNSTTRALMIALTLVGGGCATGPSVPDAGQAFSGIELDGRAAQIRLAWDHNSMITRSLRPGTMIDIVATYPTAGGHVSGEVASDSHRVVNGTNGIIFNLKKTLGKVPEGPVCMQLRINRRQSLPLRVPNSFVSSDEFYYKNWSDLVASRSRLEQANANVQRVLHQVVRAREDEDNLRRRLNEKLQGAANCADYRPPIRVAEPSRNVLEPAQWQDETQRECTYRFAKLSKRIGLPPAQLAALTTGTISSAYKATEVTANAFNLKQVVTRRLPEIQGYRTRLSEKNKLPISAETMAALRDIGTPGADKAMLQASLGIVDAFGSCLDEVQPQFKSAYEAWIAQRGSGYEQEIARTAMLECKLIQDDLNKSTQQRRTAEQQLQDFEREAALAASGGNYPGNPDKVHPLLGQTCPASF